MAQLGWFWSFRQKISKSISISVGYVSGRSVGTGVEVSRSEVLELDVLDVLGVPDILEDEILELEELERDVLLLEIAELGKLEL